MSRLHLCTHHPALHTTQQLDAIITLVIGDLTPSDRVKIITLITIDVHSRDVTQSIIDQKIDNPLAFQWLSQARLRAKSLG